VKFKDSLCIIKVFQLDENFSPCDLICDQLSVKILEKNKNGSLAVFSHIGCEVLAITILANPQ